MINLRFISDLIGFLMNIFGHERVFQYAETTNVKCSMGGHTLLSLNL